MFIEKFFNILNESKLPYFFLSPLAYAIGDSAEEIYFGLLKARRDNKKLILLRSFDIRFNKYSICNHELYDLRSPYIALHNNHPIQILLNLFITITYFPFRQISLLLRKIGHKGLPENYNFPYIGYKQLWGPNNCKQFTWKEVSNLKWKKQYDSSLEVDFSDKKKDFCKQQLEKMGINKSDWFVCLHVREPGFRNDHGRRPYRNADINNYLKAIDYIVKSGGKVIRLGDNSMSRLPLKEGVIDYPHTEFKSALMDLYLIKNCKAYMGMLSGIMDVALLFQSQFALVNMYNWTFGYPLKKNDRGILKRIFCKKRNRYLSLTELMKETNWDLQRTWPVEGFDVEISGDYEIHENCSEDIYELIKEVLNSDFETTAQQIEITQLRSKQGIRFYEEDQSNGSIYHLDNVIKYRIASRLESASGSLGKRYCEKYFNNPQKDTLVRPKENDL